MMRDTPPEVEKLFHNMIMALSPGERLRMACEMSTTGKELVLAGIRHQHPGLTLAQERGYFLVRMYGDDFTREQLERIAAHMPNMELPERSS